MTARLLVAAAFGAIFAAGSLSAQNATPGRVSPPQPRQAQRLEYFEGAWTFTWTGRESPVSPGPRTGVVTFSRTTPGGPLSFTTAGTSDAGGPFKESGSMAWDAEKKTLTVNEKLAGGLELSSTGDWSSAISIRFESAPVKAAGQTLRIRRTYSIVSEHSFTVSEEMSADGGPFVRLGGAVFGKK
jgi:hypothetical protein